MEKNAGRTNQCTQRIKENETTRHDINHQKCGNSSIGKPEIREHRKVDKTDTEFGRDCFSDDFDDGDNSSSLFWECIPNMQQDPFEMCTEEHTLRNRDKSKPSGCLDTSIISVGSFDKASVPNENINT